MMDRETEINVALALHLFGWRWLEDRRHKGHMVLVEPDTEWVEDYSDAPSDGMADVLHYSSTWEGMGLVVEAMRTKAARGYDGWWCRITSPFEPGEPWFVGFTPLGWSGWNGRPDHEAGDAAAPMAAALAALMVLGVEVTGG